MKRRQVLQGGVIAICIGATLMQAAREGWLDFLAPDSAPTPTGTKKREPTLLADATEASPSEEDPELRFDPEWLRERRFDCVKSILQARPLFVPTETGGVRPTINLGGNTAEHPSSRKPSNLRMTATLVGSQMRKAIVNGRVVGEGDQWTTASGVAVTVKEIQAGRARFEFDGVAEWLTASSDSVRDRP